MRWTLTVYALGSGLGRPRYLSEKAEAKEGREVTSNQKCPLNKFVLLSGPFGRLLFKYIHTSTCFLRLLPSFAILSVYSAATSLSPPLAKARKKIKWMRNQSHRRRDAQLHLNLQFPDPLCLQLQEQRCVSHNISTFHRFYSSGGGGEAVVVNFVWRCCDWVLGCIRTVALIRLILPITWCVCV